MMTNRQRLLCMAKGIRSGYWIEHCPEQDSYSLRQEGDENKAFILRYPKEGILIEGRLLGISESEISTLPIFEADKTEKRDYLNLESNDIESIFRLINRQ